MKGSEALEIIGDIASQQWGLLTSAQAKNHGVDLPSLRRLETRGALVRIRHGVYASVSVALSAELEVKAQWLALRPELIAADRIRDPELATEAVVSYTTAADIWGIGDLWPDGIHFTVKSRRRSRQPDVEFHKDDLAVDDWEIHPDLGVPITTVARTIADIARDGSYEQGHLLGLVADAGRKDLVDEGELLDSVAGFEDAFGAKKGDRQSLRELLREYFPEDPSAHHIRSIIEEALAPLEAKVEEIMQRNKLAAPEDINDALIKVLREYTVRKQP